MLTFLHGILFMDILFKISKMEIINTNDIVSVSRHIRHEWVTYVTRFFIQLRGPEGSAAVVNNQRSAWVVKKHLVRTPGSQKDNYLYWAVAVTAPLGSIQQVNLKKTDSQRSFSVISLHNGRSARTKLMYTVSFGGKHHSFRKNGNSGEIKGHWYQCIY